MATPDSSADEGDKEDAEAQERIAAKALDKAVTKTKEIMDMHRGNQGAAAIARRYRLDPGAVEEVIRRNTGAEKGPPRVADRTERGGRTDDSDDRDLEPLHRPTPSPAEKGAYRSLDASDNLFAIMIENGAKEDDARGVWRYIRHFDPDDLTAIKRGLRTLPLSQERKDRILDTYKLELGEPDETGRVSAQVESATSDERLARLRKMIHGEKGETTAEESELDRLEKKAKQLEIENLEADLESKRLEAAERRKAMGVEPTSSNPADDTVVIPLNFGGFPVPTRIKKSEMGYYAQWMPKPQDADKPPNWAQSLIDRIGALEAKTAPSQPVGPSASDQRVDQLQAQLNAEREARMRGETDEAKARAEAAMRAASEARSQISQMASPQYQAWVKQQNDAAFRTLGYRPEGEMSALSDEAIQRQSLLESEKTKNQAVAQGIQVGMRKLGETGKLKEGVMEAGLPKVAVRLVEQSLSTPEERATAPLPPTPEQLAAMEASQGAAGGGTAHMAGPAGPGGPGPGVVGACVICGEPLLAGTRHECSGVPRGAA